MYSHVVQLSSVKLWLGSLALKVPLNRGGAEREGGGVSLLNGILPELLASLVFELNEYNVVSWCE